MKTKIPDESNVNVPKTENADHGQVSVANMLDPMQSKESTGNSKLKSAGGASKKRTKKHNTTFAAQSNEANGKHEKQSSTTSGKSFKKTPMLKKNSKLVSNPKTSFRVLQRPVQAPTQHSNTLELQDPKKLKLSVEDAPCTMSAVNATLSRVVYGTIPHNANTATQKSSHKSSTGQPSIIPTKSRVRRGQGRRTTNTRRDIRMKFGVREVNVSCSTTTTDDVSKPNTIVGAQPVVSTHFSSTDVRVLTRPSPSHSEQPTVEPETNNDVSNTSAFPEGDALFENIVTRTSDNHKSEPAEDDAFVRPREAQYEKLRAQLFPDNMMSVGETLDPGYSFHRANAGPTMYSHEQFSSGFDSDYFREYPQTIHPQFLYHAHAQSAQVQNHTPLGYAPQYAYWPNNFQPMPVQAPGQLWGAYQQYAFPANRLSHQSPEAMSESFNRMCSTVEKPSGAVGYENHSNIGHTWYPMQANNEYCSVDTSTISAQSHRKICLSTTTPSVSNTDVSVASTITGYPTNASASSELSKNVSTQRRSQSIEHATNEARTDVAPAEQNNRRDSQMTNPSGSFAESDSAKTMKISSETTNQSSLDNHTGQLDWSVCGTVSRSSSSNMPSTSNTETSQVPSQSHSSTTDTTMVTNTSHSPSDAVTDDVSDGLSSSDSLSGSDGLTASTGMSLSLWHTAMPNSMAFPLPESHRQTRPEVPVNVLEAFGQTD